MQTEQAKTNQITEGIIWKQLLLFFFPILLGSFFQQIYNTADAIIVGRYAGKEALASVGGSSTMIINLVVGVFIGVSSGATVLISQYYGAKDKKNLDRALHTAAAFSLVGSLIITILGVWLSPLFLELMNTPAELMKDSTIYLRVFFSGTVFVFIYNVGSAVLRAAGDSKRPLYYLMICCLLNIVLDLLFVMGMNLGVLGAALGTLISQGISAVLVVAALLRSRDMYRLSLGKIRFHRASLHALLRIGIPAGLQSVMYNISNVIIQACLNAFGTDAMAAWTAYGKMDGIYWMMIYAFGIAISTFVGQNYGAGKYSRMRKSVRVGLGMALAAAVAMSVVFLLFGRYILQLFTGDPAVVNIGMSLVRLVTPAYAVYVFTEIFSGALRGTGDVLIPTLMTCGGICAFRLLWVALVVPFNRTLATIVLCYPLSWVITAILFIFYYQYRKRRWPKEQSL